MGKMGYEYKKVYVQCRKNKSSEDSHVHTQVHVQHLIFISSSI